MQIYQAVILGFVQGITEFLPVSSSGHLILLEKFLGISSNLLFYSVALHIGTLIPVIILLRKEIIGLMKKPYDKLLCLIIATLPAVVVGLIVGLFVDFDKLFSQNVKLLSVTFTVTAIELLLANKKTCNRGNGINYKRSLVTGIGQALAIFPGLSRSGTTAVFGRLAEMDGEENASWTFLMSIPVIVGGLILTTGKIIATGTTESIDILPLLIGIISSATFGYIAMSFMTGIIKKANYGWFSFYLVILSLITAIFG